jgi:hypothetical protein
MAILPMRLTVKCSFSMYLLKIQKVQKENINKMNVDIPVWLNC